MGRSTPLASCPEADVAAFSAGWKTAVDGDVALDPSRLWLAVPGNLAQKSSAMNGR